MNKTLYCSEKNKKIAGVCGGLGEYFEIDPTLIRLVFALLFFGYGTGVMLYILLWIILPEESAVKARAYSTENKAKNIDEVAITPDKIIDAEK